MGVVTLTGVRKTFGRLDVIKNVDLHVPAGSFTVFVGPSGCGKSTLLRLIAGLEDISAGTLTIGDRVVNDVPPAKRGVAMVFQSYALYPHMTVYQNMAFGLKLAGNDRAAIDRRVREASRILQIDPLLERKPKQLSGGQRQRVAIGRAITREPAVFLFDEPLSNLDAALRVQTRLELAKLHRDLGATMIYVTHDQVEAMTLADQIVVLRAGRVEQIGPPMTLYHRPCNRFVAEFIGSPKMNAVSCVLEAADGAGTRVRVPGCDRAVAPAVQASSGLAIGGLVTLGIRPEHVLIAANGAAPQASTRLDGKIAVVERLGGQTVFHVDTPAGPLMVLADGGTLGSVGDTIPLCLPDTACHVFDQDGQALTRM